MNYSNEVKQLLAEGLVGTSGVYDDAYCAAHGVNPEHLDEVLAEKEVVRCDTCGWWVEASECTDNDGENKCEDCQGE